MDSRGKRASENLWGDDFVTYNAYSDKRNFDSDDEQSDASGGTASRGNDDGQDEDKLMNDASECDDPASLAPSPQAPKSWLREAWYAAVRSACSPQAGLFFLLAAQTTIVAPNLTLLAQELQFSDEDKDKLLGGRLTLVFFLSGCPCAIATGCLSDILRGVHRRVLIFLLSLLAFLSTISVSAIPENPEDPGQTFMALLGLRGICGGVSAAAMTLGTAMLVDSVDVRALPVAASCGGVVYTLGAAFGLLLGSWFGAPKRTEAEEAAAAPRTMPLTFLSLFRDDDASSSGSAAAAAEGGGAGGVPASPGDDAGAADAAGGGSGLFSSQLSTSGWRAPFFLLGASGIAYGTLCLLFFCCCCSGGGEGGRGGSGGKAARAAAEARRRRQQTRRLLAKQKTTEKGRRDGTADGDSSDGDACDNDSGGDEEAAAADGKDAYNAWAMLGHSPRRRDMSTLDGEAFGAFRGYGDEQRDHQSLSCAMSEQAYNAMNSPLAGTWGKGRRKSATKGRNVGCCYLLCCIPTILLLLLAMVVSWAPVGVLDAFWTDYLVLIIFTERTADELWFASSWTISGGTDTPDLYSSKWELATRMAAHVSVAVQVGLASGQVVGGLLGVCFHGRTRDDATGRVRRRIVVKDGEASEVVAGEGSALRCVFCTMAAAALVTPLPFLYVLLAAPSTASDSSFELNYLGMSFLGGFFRGLIDPLSRTLVLLLTPRGLQGASASILIVVMELGRALGPTVVAEMTASSHVGQGRREQAFAYAFLAWFAAVPLYLLLLCIGPADARRARYLASEMKEKEAQPASMLLRQ